MSQIKPSPLRPSAKIDEATITGIAWGGVSLGVLFFAFRILVRYKIFGRLHADDGLVFFAWILLLTNTVLWQTGKDAMYEMIAVTRGHLFPPPANFEHNSERYLRESVVVIVFFYTGLWSIKLSFLILFKRLGQNVRHQGLVWWTVLIITAASYLACLGNLDWKCLASPLSYIEAHCAYTPESVKFGRQTMRSNMALDVVTDALIILVPINLLWKVRLSIRKKLALGGIFSITVIIMVFAIVRVIVISSYSSEPDQSWLYMWSSIEQTVSIMVACIASFPSLFRNSERDSKHWAATEKLVRLLFSPRSWSRKSFKEISEFAEQEPHTAINLPDIPGGTMTGVRTFIDKQGKTVISNSQSFATTEGDEDFLPLSGHMAHRQV